MKIDIRKVKTGRIVRVGEGVAKTLVRTGYFEYVEDMSAGAEFYIPLAASVDTVEPPVDVAEDVVEEEAPKKRRRKKKEETESEE